MRSAYTDQLWGRWCLDANTDDWADLCEALKIPDYDDGDINSREFRKRVNEANPSDQRLEQCFARLKGWAVSIPAQEAYRLIAALGFDWVEVHPACDEVHLSDGRTLNLWEGGGEHDRYWTIEGKAKS